MVRTDAAGNALVRCSTCKCWHSAAQFANDRHGNPRKCCNGCKTKREPVNYSAAETNKTVIRCIETMCYHIAETSTQLLFARGRELGGRGAWCHSAMSVSDLLNINSPAVHFIPLDVVATFEYERGTQAVQRYNMATQVVIMVSVSLSSRLRKAEETDGIFMAITVNKDAYKTSSPEQPTTDYVYRKHICVICDKEANKLCNRCKFSHYCSRDCQIVHWPVHKSDCNQLKALKVNSLDLLHDDADLGAMLKRPENLRPRRAGPLQH